MVERQGTSCGPVCAAPSCGNRAKRSDEHTSVGEYFGTLEVKVCIYINIPTLHTRSLSLPIMLNNMYVCDSIDICVI